MESEILYGKTTEVIIVTKIKIAQLEDKHVEKWNKSFIEII